MDAPQRRPPPDDAARLRRAGLRVTAARQAVLALLREAGRPLSHAEVVDALVGSPWDRATLYRNLQDLTVAGLVVRGDLGDHLWRFELVPEVSHAAAHPHFVCVGCGDVACLPALALPSAPAGIPTSVREGRAEIQIRGRCDRCEAGVEAAP